MGEDRQPHSVVDTDWLVEKLVQYLLCCDWMADMLDRCDWLMTLLVHTAVEVDRQDHLVEVGSSESVVDNLLALSMEEVGLKNKTHACRGCHKARLELILLKMLRSVN